MTTWGWLFTIWCVFMACFLALMLWRMHRKGLEAKAREAVRKRHAFGPWRWSQDGWVRRCKFCQTVDYGGDDYEGGPE